MPEIDERIEEVAGGLSSVTSDGTTVTQHNIKDLIEADKYLTQKEAKANKWNGIRVQKLVPPGTV